jgi:3-oxoacyl-[acyl-carrier-protein] synthase III
MRAAIKAIEYFLPKGVLTNAELAAEFTHWTADNIEQKTGINERRIAATDECSSDLGAAAAKLLFDSGVCTPRDIEYVLFCTQSPDYFLPTTACILQHRLGIPREAGALDFNLGCSGFVYGLGLAKGLIETGQVRNVLLITAETYSKFISPRDGGVRTLFGDGAAATLIGPIKNGSEDYLGPFVHGTDGSGSAHLIVPGGALRKSRPDLEELEDSDGNFRSEANLYMNGPEIFNFTLKVVPNVISRLLARAEKDLACVDWFVFHQANAYILEHLRKKLTIPREKFAVTLGDCGNTVSSTIPIALKKLSSSGCLKNGQSIMLVGFGVGYSWAAAMSRWTAES